MQGISTRGFNAKQFAPVQVSLGYKLSAGLASVLPGSGGPGVFHTSSQQSSFSAPMPFPASAIPRAGRSAVRTARDPEIGLHIP